MKLFLKCMISIILGDLAMTSTFVVMQNKIGPGLTFFFFTLGYLQLMSKKLTAPLKQKNNLHTICAF